MKLLAISFLVTATVACTASTTDEASTSSAATAAPTNDERLCTQECAWRDRCGSETYAACLPSCLRRYTNHGVSLREEFVARVEGCFPALTCSQFDDACYSLVGDYASVPEVRACLARYQSCSAAFSDDHCYTIGALTDAARADAAACLTEDCGRVSRCMKRAIGEN